jgi:hypothetical protein
MAQGLDKYLGGASIASQETIQNIVGQMLANAFAERDAQLQQIVNQVATKLQQLEAAIGQVALAAQQTKMSPFDIAMKAITHFGDEEPDPAAKRCWEKGVAIMERWLDAALETSATGSGDARRTPSPAREAQAEAHSEEGEYRPPASESQAEG